MRLLFAQHLVRHDGVQNGLLLPGMEVQPIASGHHIFAKPPQQQLGGGGCDQRQNVGRARFKAQAVMVGSGGDARR